MARGTKKAELWESLRATRFKGKKNKIYYGPE